VVIEKVSKVLEAHVLPCIIPSPNTPFSLVMLIICSCIHLLLLLAETRVTTGATHKTEKQSVHNSSNPNCCKQTIQYENIKEEKVLSSNLISPAISSNSNIFIPERKACDEVQCQFIFKYEFGWYGKMWYQLWMHK